MAYISCPFHWYWAKIQDYWNKEMYFNHSLLAAICSDWYCTGSMWPDCNWTVKFCSQWTSHMKPSATSTTGSPDLLESTFKRALEMHLFSTARRHWDVFMILAPNINISRLTYLQAWRSITEQGKFASQRPTFYHCATQPTQKSITYRSRAWNYFAVQLQHSSSCCICTAELKETISSGISRNKQI